ncbi:MAG: peptidylprolyl isomerase [Arcobacteraceae bacterium]
MKFLAALLCAFFLHTSASANTYAIVNGEEINIDEINYFIKSIDKEGSYVKLSNEDKNLILHQVIEKKLLIQEAKKEKLEDNKEFQKTLMDIKNNLLVEFWMKKKFNSIVVSEKDIETYYNAHLDEFKQEFQLKARHIVVETLEEANAIINELNQTKTDIQKKFILLAKEKSIEPAGPNGGDLGWFKKGIMMDEFWDEAVALKEKHYTKKPLKTLFGYHIIYLDAKQEAYTVKLDQVYLTIKNKLQMDTFQKNVDESIKKIKQKAQISVIK